MSSKKDCPGDSDWEEIERLEEEARKIPDERKTLGQGPHVLRAQLEKAAQRKQQLTIRLDRDIIARFKKLAGPDGSYQTLMNRALHDWLEAGNVQELLQAELAELKEIAQSLKSEPIIQKEVLLQDHEPIEGHHIRSLMPLH